VNGRIPEANYSHYITKPPKKKFYKQKKTKYKTVKLNAALEVIRTKKVEAVLLYFMNWKLALPKGETKIDRPAKHDLQLCAPVCQATFTVNYATAADIPVHVVAMARSICSLHVSVDYAF